MKRILSQISILAYYQIIGGIVGLIVTFLTLYDLPVFAIFNVLVVLLIIGLYSFSIYSGIVLLKKKYIKGLNLSIYNNAIQIISVHLFGFYYLYYSGIQLAISIDLTNDTIFGISLWYSN